MNTHKAMNWTILVFGIWQVIAAFILGYVDVGAAMWNAVIAGSVLVILGFWAARTEAPGTARGLSFTNVALGVWLVASPFLLGYNAITAALVNDLVVGSVVIVAAGVALLALGNSQDSSRNPA